MRQPSVLLHDHLDGGVRPETVLELAREQRYDGLPPSAVEDPASWFDQSSSGSLESYLSAFDHTIALMQNVSSLERVSYECALDLAADGVVYAEIRFCPRLHTVGGLSPDAVISAVAAGMAAGSTRSGLRWGLIIDSLRQFHDSEETARLAARNRASGVVGFDLAGPESGFPPRWYAAGLRRAIAEGLRITIHAGESAGVQAPAYIAQALEIGNAERIGHGIELIRDCTVEDGEIVRIGSVARRVLDRGIALEMCPQSNLATSGLEPSQHPLGMMYRAGFNVTLNTDNRLMSATSMSREFSFAKTFHGFTERDLGLVTVRSMLASFASRDVKAEIIRDVVMPAYDLTQSKEAALSPGMRVR